MSEHPQNRGRHVRRVVLASGRAIQVVYFEATPRPLDGLHICPECDRDLVYPVEWEEVSQIHWELLLHCPNCEWTEVGTFDQPTVDRFDEQLDAGTEILKHDLKRLERSNMEDEIERFARALDAGAILPEDF